MIFLTHFAIPKTFHNSKDQAKYLKEFFSAEDAQIHQRKGVNTFNVECLFENGRFAILGKCI